MTLPFRLTRILLSLAVHTAGTAASQTPPSTADTIATTHLDVVTVTARRPVATVTADKISYTPAATISGSGGSIHDTLASLPGVSIDSKGAISVYGQRGISVMVDGRKSILSGDMLNNYLKALPAANVDRIEIITSPSSRHDASGSHTAINIRLKRSTDRGFTFGAGTDGRLWKARRATANLYAGYTQGSHRLSLTYSALTARYPSTLLTDRPYGDGGLRLSQYYDRRRRDHSHHISLAYDCDISETFTLGSSLAADLYTRHERAAMTTTVPGMTAATLTGNNTRFHTSNIYGNLYLRHTPQRPGSSLTLSFDFFSHRNNERQAMDDNTGTDIDCDMGGNTSGYVGALDLRHRLTEGWEISAGLRGSYVAMHNDGHYTGTTDRLGSTFGYDENINAIYAESRSRHNRLTATVGLRMEQTNFSTVFTGNEASARTDHTDHTLGLFPSIALTLDAGRHNDLSVSYARRISRPRYADLNPFIHIFDDITHVGGNISLRPSSSHHVQAVWSHASRLRISTSLTHTSGDIVKCYREITDRIVYVSPENLPRHLGWSLSIAAVNLPVARWWRLSAGATLLYTNYHFPTHTSIRPNCLFTPMAELKNHFDFTRGWAAEVSGSVRGRSAYGQARISPAGQLYIGIRKSIMNSRAQITLYARDLLNTNHTTSTISLSGSHGSVKEREYEGMRLIGASFSIRLHTGSGRGHIKGKNSCIDEMNRVNL